MLVDAEPLARKSLSDCWAGHFANEQMDDGHIAGYVPVTSCNHAEPQSVDILDLPLARIDWNLWQLASYRFSLAFVRHIFLPSCKMCFCLRFDLPKRTVLVRT